MQEREVKAKHQQLISGVLLFSLEVLALVISNLSELALFMLFMFDPFRYLYCHIGLQHTFGTLSASYFLHLLPYSSSTYLVRV